MKLIEGEVIAGQRIGSIGLNITKDELIIIIGNDYNILVQETCIIIEIENARFWISSDGKVDQIGVGKGFEGKYKNIIGLGSTLNEVKKYVGNYINVYDTFEIENESGICFELGDVEEWNELKAPIEFIYVFRNKM